MANFMQMENITQKLKAANVEDETIDLGNKFQTEMIR